MKTYEVWAVEVLGPDGWQLVQITNFEANARKMIERKHHKTMSVKFREISDIASMSTISAW